MNSAATVIGEGDKLINVVLLNGERLNVRVQAQATGQDLYNIITDHLGVTETTFFGLMIIKDGELEFLDFNEKLSKLAKFAPHLWKDDVSCNSSLVFTIFFRVKYYVENICLLQQQSTRHLYYLQLRKDVLEGGIYIHEETAMLLASYALQAEVGDYNQNLHGTDYFVPEHYLPQRAIAKLTASSIKKQLPSMHKTHTGLSDAQAEIEYLKEAQKLQEYGIIFNKVSKYKKDKRGGFSLGISVRGLIVYEERGIVKSPTFRHPWQNIKRMAFHRRRFYIEAHGDPETSKLVLYTCSYKKSRYLLKMCTSFYKFQMMMGMRLSNLKEYPKDDGVVRMNGVVKTDETDSVVGDMPVPTEEAKPNQAQDSAVIQPPGIGPAIHLNGSAGPKQEDQPVQVSVHPVQLQKVDGSLGLNIIGGIELGGIYVKTMAPEGPASLSGKINIGDRILEINGQSLEGLSRQEAVNILRTAPYVCTMLIESCVAAPATPNGKPALPGSQSTSAFYQPNRHQQMQPMMQRQPSLESQCSSVHQQFVPGKSHQIEDIVSVSTLSIEKTKSVTSLPLDKHNSSDTLAWGQPLEVNPAAVSAQIRKRAMRKKMMISESASLDKGGSQTSMEEAKDLRKASSTIASPQITESAPRNKLSMSAFSFFGSFQGKRDEHAYLTSKDEKTSVGDRQFPTSDNLEQQPGEGTQGMFQGENPSGLDEQSTLLNFPEQKVPENDDSNVVGFFRKIQSFLFSPSTTFSQSKQPDEAESSCCESDLDSEFSEITSGSFNPGEIESVREELESLLLRDSPNSQKGVCVELTHGELSLGEHSGEPVSQGQVSDFETKEGSNFEKDKKDSGELGSRFSIFRALSVFAKNDKPLEDNKKDKTLEDNGNDKASEDDAIDKSLENDTMEKWDDEHANVHDEDIEDKKQLITTEDTKSKSTVDDGLEKSSPMDEDVKQEEQRDREEKESSIDTSTENKKETTV